MYAPIRELEQLGTLCREGREHLAAGRLLQAADAADAALAIDARHVPALALKADALHAMGQWEEAEGLRRLVRQLKREAWQHQVEAEIRGQHDLMGEAIRHAQF